MESCQCRCINPPRLPEGQIAVGICARILHYIERRIVIRPSRYNRLVGINDCLMQKVGMYRAVAVQVGACLSTRPRIQLQNTPNWLLLRNKSCAPMFHCRSWPVALHTKGASGIGAYRNPTSSPWLYVPDPPPAALEGRNAARITVCR